MSSSSKRFPLSSSPFAPLSLTLTDETAIANIANDLLVTTLMDYEMLQRSEGGFMNASRWKIAKRLDNLTGYQERRTSSTDVEDTPRLIWRGTLDGSLSDIMFGVLNQSDEEEQVKAAYTKSNVVDSKVLASLATATPTDPFNGLQIKWMVSTSGRGLKRLVKLRDFVYIEATGITHRPSGESIGFHLIHSLSIPSLRHLPDHNLVRGNISLLHIYREKTSNTVELYTKSSLNLMGSMPSRLAMYSACKTMETTERLQAWSHQKKLACMLLTMRSRPPSVKVSHDCSSCRLCPKYLHRERSLRHRTRHCRICSVSVCSKCCQLTTVSFLDSHTSRPSTRTMRFCTGCISKATHTSGEQMQIDELEQGALTADFTDTRSTMSLSASKSSKYSVPGAGETCLDTLPDTYLSISSDTFRDSFRGLQ